MIVDLFAGIGWAEGLEPLGLCETGLELAPAACATRRAAGHRTVECDVTLEDPAAHDGAEGLIGSPPCPGFGKSGKKLGLQDLPRVYQAIDDLAAGRDTRAGLHAQCLDFRSILTAEPVRWLYALRPEWVALEQVPSVLPVWEHIARILERWGYSAATGVLDAAGYGLGQTRPRAILIASRVREVALPPATHGPGLLPYTSMADVIGWGYTRRPAPTVTGGGTATGGAEPFGNGTRQAMRTAIGTKAWADRDVPALRSGAPNLRPTIREAALLQGFRPGLLWLGRQGEQYLAVGNAVPPPLATAVVAAAAGIPGNPPRPSSLSCPPPPDPPTEGLLMSSRNQRRELPGDMFPGMVDVLAKRPPKAEDGEHVARTLDEAIARSFEILDEALATYPIVGSYWLFSGGNDSVIVGHLLRGRYDGVLHVNTGTGIPETTQHVRDVAAAWGDTLHELHPRNSYEDLILGKVLATRGPNTGIRAVWQGFPGPVGHRVMYRHLKDEPLMTFRRSVVGDQGRTRKVIYLGGMRWAETERRFRNAEAIDQDGAIVWVSPLVHWTDAHMREYRARHRCQQDHEHAEHRLCFDGALPLNEVTEHIHMSGECLCGAYAKPGELDEIGFFYPETAAKLRDLEEQVRAADIPACRWGQKPPGEGSASPAGRLCSSCVAIPGQDDLIDQWRDTGLITPEQHAAFNAPAP